MKTMFIHTAKFRKIRILLNDHMMYCKTISEGASRNWRKYLIYESKRKKRQMKDEEKEQKYTKVKERRGN